MYKYLLFDLDGTLTDPKEGITRSVRHALLYFGIDVPAEELTLFIGPPLREQFMEYASLSPLRMVTAPLLTIASAMPTLASSKTASSRALPSF